MIFIWVLNISNMSASTLWVDDDSPSGDGMRETPFPTINEAVASASPYDTVYVLPGTYEENLVIDIPLSLIGSGASVTSIISANSTLTFNDDCEIRGFTIESGCVYCSSGVARISENVIQFKGTLGSWGIFVQCDSSFINKNFVTGFDTPIFVHPPFAPYNGFCEIRNNILFSLNDFRGLWIESRIDLRAHRANIQPCGYGLRLSPVDMV